MSAAPAIALQLVPVTPAVAALLHQMQQEAIEASPAPEPGSVVLVPRGPWARRSPANSATYQSAYDWEGCSVYLSYHFLRPGLWTGEESRRDAQGRHWKRFITAITDDFGDLVEVAQ